MDPHKIADLLRPLIVIMLPIFFIILIYGFLTKDDIDDGFSVTVTYDCHIVLEQKNNYPDNIVDMCEQLRRNGI
jgi:hypothetical protein